MIESFASELLSKYLGRYILGFEKNNIKLAISSGSLELKNLELNLESFSDINLPFKIKKGNRTKKMHTK